MYILSRKDSIDRYFNEITEYLDRYLKSVDLDYYKTYVYNEKYKNKYPLRVSGCTVGHIEVDENNFIQDIKLYDDTLDWYEDGVLENIIQFYNKRLVMCINQE